MIARWRALPPLAQDVLAGLAFAFIWFTFFDYWTARDWYPSHPSTYRLAGAWSGAAIALHRLTPRSLLYITAIAYPYFYSQGMLPLQTEFHLLPILIAGYGAAVYGKMRAWVAPLLSIIGVTLVSTQWFSAGSDQSALMFNVFATIAVVFLGRLIRQQRETASTLAEKNAELEELRAMESTRAVAEERTRIARELHDVVAHHLVAMIVKGQAAVRLAPHQPGLADESLIWMVDTARDALTSTRQTVKVLRTDEEAPMLAPEPGLADLDAIVQRMADAGLEMKLEIDQPLPELDDHVQLAAVRIAQEALTNTLKHSHASKAVVTLRGEASGVRLEIENDGIPWTPILNGTKGHGVLGMRERATSVGGDLEIDSGPLGGWRVSALLPASARGEVT